MLDDMHFSFDDGNTLHCQHQVFDLRDAAICHLQDAARGRMRLEFFWGDRRVVRRADHEYHWEISNLIGYPAKKWIKMIIYLPQQKPYKWILGSYWGLSAKPASTCSLSGSETRLLGATSKPWLCTTRQTVHWRSQQHSWFPWWSHCAWNAFGWEPVEQRGSCYVARSVHKVSTIFQKMCKHMVAVLIMYSLDCVIRLLFLCLGCLLFFIYLLNLISLLNLVCLNLWVLCLPSFSVCFSLQCCLLCILRLLGLLCFRGCSLSKCCCGLGLLGLFGRSTVFDIFGLVTFWIWKCLGGKLSQLAQLLAFTLAATCIFPGCSLLRALFLVFALGRQVFLFLQVLELQLRSALYNLSGKRGNPQTC